MLDTPRPTRSGRLAGRRCATTDLAPEQLAGQRTRSIFDLCSIPFPSTQAAPYGRVNPRGPAENSRTAYRRARHQGLSGIG